MAQHPYVTWSLGPTTVKSESLEPLGKGSYELRLYTMISPSAVSRVPSFRRRMTGFLAVATV